jgi:hypothetical protein
VRHETPADRAIRTKTRDPPTRGTICLGHGKAGPRPRDNAAVRSERRTGETGSENTYKARRMTSASTPPAAWHDIPRRDGSPDSLSLNENDHRNLP